MCGCCMGLVRFEIAVQFAFFRRQVASLHFCPEGNKKVFLNEAPNPEGLGILLRF
jgi:hypothetical protein